MRRIGLLGVAMAGALLAEAMKPRSLATLPNTHGFRFTGHKRDGSKVQCVVAREPSSGMHFAETLDGVRIFNEITAWSPEEF